MNKTDPGPIICDLNGPTVTPEEKEILMHPNVGGVIFFARHFESPEQMSMLSNKIKSMRPDLLLCVDQEGGQVQRFQKGFTRLPPLKILGDLWDLDESNATEVLAMSWQLGQLMALEVRAVGIDLSFAPVVDLGKGLSTVIRDRAFHADPQKVSQLAYAYMQGMAEWGMSATIKHFPGHGSVALDSHLALPEDTRPLDALAGDLFPFQALIKKQVPALMTAHINYPSVAPEPVTFSSYWLQDILREKMGFTGTIISDDLSMGGAAGMGTYAERAVKAVLAGCDYILVCNNRPGALEAIDALKIESSKESIVRRKQLLAKKTVPSWQALQSFEPWQQLTTILSQRLALQSTGTE